ncbi:hypothetical protein N8743_00665 [Candidatus Pelagibacter ubique]|nr:hypothetical protein [Candidatus Pelagibacter ubique]
MVDRRGQPKVNEFVEISISYKVIQYCNRYFEVVTPIRKDPNRGMKFVKCNNDPINRGKLGHSKTFLKHIKKDRGYY